MASVRASVIESCRFAFLCLIALFSATAIWAAPECNVKAPVPSTARVFARVDDHSVWREFRTIEEVPELGNDGGISGQFWRDSRGNALAYTVEPGEDFWIYTRYCFNAAGELQGVGFEIRTAWDWGYQLEGAALNGELRIQSAHFFDTSNDRPISRPNGADDIPEALKPTLYLTVTKLPFANLLAAARLSDR